MYKAIVNGIIGKPEDFDLYPRQVSISFNTTEHLKSEVNIYVQIEPEELMSYDWLLTAYPAFDIIFCWEMKLLSLPNAVLFPFGTCWVDTKKKFHKTLALSNLMSGKSFLPGHYLRHKIFENVPQLSIPTLNIKSPPRIESKDVLFDGFMYSVIIENVVRDHWFTEKIIDSLVSETIPLYHGCPNISDYFDNSYFLNFNNVSEFNQITQNLSEQYYFDNLDKIKNNRELALQYADIYQRLRNQIRALLFT